MSGIAAIIRFDGGPVETGLIEKMTSVMAHRGPDGINHWVKDSVAVGQCMLRTTPESLEEVQPLTNDDESLVLVMDGWLQNWLELRQQLLTRGVHLRTPSDAELVLRAYELWGAECLSHIDGNFAFVIWNSRTQSAFCARDHVGQKQFHYYWDGCTLVVATELCAILELPFVSEVQNEGMIAEFLAGDWYSRNETLWTGIMRLDAAHRMQVTDAGARIEKYWSLPLDFTFSYKRDQDYIEHYRELFSDCVRRASRSHRCVAYEVSGGLDSTGIFCMAAHLRDDGRLPAPSIAGYTFAFNDNSDADEIEYAREVGNHLGIDISEIAPFRPTLSWFEQIAKLERKFPGFPNAAMSVNLHATMAANGSRVVINGEGGDEWMGGYHLYYAEELAAGRWSEVLKCLKRDLAAANLPNVAYWFLRHGLFHLLPTEVQNALRKISSFRPVEPSTMPYWLAPDMQAALDARRQEFTPNAKVCPGRHGQRAMLGNLTNAFFVSALESCEQFGARASLEVRSPMHLRAFIEFASALPERLRLRGNTTKFIHREALSDYLPLMISRRDDKAEFSDAFRGYLDSMADLMTETIPKRRPNWVSARGMAHLYKSYSTHKFMGYGQWELWSIFGCDCVMGAQRPA